MIEPILLLIRPKLIVEIGSEEGKNTRLLLEFCRYHEAVVHSIDPQPMNDMVAWAKEYKDKFVFHAGLSLSELPSVGPMDVVLIDGDHNWYTVFNELKLIERLSTKHGHEFPLVMLHDTSWPYGRRDMYYSPETIPSAHRKPYQRKGMRPGVSILQDEGGLNPNFLNATHEDDIESGVLTAIEDFVGESEQELQMLQVPGLHGLGIMAPQALLAANTALKELFENPGVHLLRAGYVDGLERFRIEAEIALLEHKERSKVGEAKRKEENERLRAKLAAEAKLSEGLGEQLAAETERLVNLRAALEAESRLSEDMRRKLARKQTKLTALEGDQQNARASMDALTQWLEKLQYQLVLLLETRRWMVGDLLGSIWQKVLRKRQGPLPHSSMVEVFDQFNSWQMSQRQSQRLNQQSRYDWNLTPDSAYGARVGLPDEASPESESKALAIIQVTPEDVRNPYFTQMGDVFIASGWDYAYSGDLAEVADRAKRVEGNLVCWFHQFDPFYHFIGDLQGTRNRVKDLIRILRDMADTGVTLVHTWHNPVPHDKSFLESDYSLYSSLNEILDGIIVHWSKGAEWIQRFCPSVPVFVLPHPSLVSHFDSATHRTLARSQLGIENDLFIFITFGEVKPYKNITLLLDAWDAYQQGAAAERTLLFITGKWKDSEDDLDRARGLPNVRVVDRYLQDNELSQYIAASNAAVFTHRDVWVSGAALAAMSFGRPVIVPSDTGLVDYVLDEDNGFVFLNGNVGSLVQTFERMRSCPFIEHMEFMNRSWAVETSPGALQPRYAAVIRGLAGNKGT